MTQIITSLSEISANYDAMFVDLWGCMHNGITAYPEAVRAMQNYRAQGGKVILVTNAPRAWPFVATQMGEFGVPADAYDAIATSGDAARVALFSGVVGEKVWFIGEERDLTVFEPIKVVKDPVAIEITPLTEAEGIVNCGPFDTKADPDVMRGEFLFAREKGMKMLCFNPDIIIDRGESREYCAGALAKLYEEMGGEVFYFGKPHSPIYDLARRRLADLDVNADQARILCVGDGIRTDILGAAGEGYDSLFVTGGLAAQETATKVQPDPERLNAFIQSEKIEATYAIGYVR